MNEITKLISSHLKRHLPNVFLLTWALAAVGATITHLFFTARVANASAWGMAAGWQREIAFFDFILAFSGLYSVLTKNFTLQKYLCFMLPSLCIFLGGNHFATYLQSGQTLHLQWSLLNALAIFFGFSSFQILKNGESLRSRQTIEKS